MKFPFSYLILFGFLNALHFIVVNSICVRGIMRIIDNGKQPRHVFKIIGSVLCDNLFLLLIYCFRFEVVLISIYGMIMFRSFFPSPSYS